jgi:Holliday junction resolvase RusA-like endonuclease
MSKKPKATATDFHFGIDAIIPSTQQAYHHGAFDVEVRKDESEALVVFKEKVSVNIDNKLSHNDRFPTDRETFVFIMQYFAVQSEYDRRDVDNMAKTVLDILKPRFYKDDCQVKTLLVGKKIEHRVPKNFAYVSIKELSPTQDVDALKISGLERSVTMFQELRSKGVL